MGHKRADDIGPGQGAPMARILVIDDDEQVRKALRALLQREGYDVAEAPDGREGMKAVQEHIPDLVMADIIMPEQDGLETIRKIRKDYPDVKVVAISGGGDLEPRFYLHFASGFGALRTLTKPFERQELLDTVRELLD